MAAVDAVRRRRRRGRARVPGWSWRTSRCRPPVAGACVRVVVDLPDDAVGGVPMDAVAGVVAGAVPAARRHRRDGRRAVRARGDARRASTGR